MVRDIGEHTFNFAVLVFKLGSKIPPSHTGSIITNQVSRSSASIGANVEEARGVLRRDEFIYKMSVALRETRETNYWLRLMRATGCLVTSEIDGLIAEPDQRRRIPGSLVSRSRRNRAQKKSV